MDVRRIQNAKPKKGHQVMTQESEITAQADKVRDP